MAKSYEALIRLPTFFERFEYLKLGSFVGQETFGFDRYLNQVLYRSMEWRHVRRQVLLRDNGCDLGIQDRQIFSSPLVHHINPIALEDIDLRNPCIFDLNNLITTSHNTHNAIHYGDATLLSALPKERTKGDTTPWLRQV